MKRQLIVVCDMEGASGIFDKDLQAVIHSSDRWEQYGRNCITSDVLAVCSAASEFGMDEVLLYDMHYAGKDTPNVLVEALPNYVRLFDVPDRKLLWRRIRGQAMMDPFGLITVGQHARFGEPNAYFPHTIQSPPIRSITFNGLHISEIGHAVLSFQQVRYLANIGCMASMNEARELCPDVALIPVKDKSRNWEPTIEETFPIIQRGALSALASANEAQRTTFQDPFEFEMEISEGFVFAPPKSIPWVGSFSERKALWTAPSVEIGLEIFHLVRGCIIRSVA